MMSDVERMKAQIERRTGEIVDAYVGGESLDKIADRMRLDAKRVRALLVANGVTIRVSGVPGKLPSQSIADIRRLAEEGKTRREIARELGFVYETVCNLARRYAIEIRNKSGNVVRARPQRVTAALRGMRMLSNDERLYVMAQFCRHCGSNDRGCSCERDE
jgi:DNA-binding NarL/FixJ family response regulator